MELYQPNYEYFSHLRITDIVFDETRVLATLFGQYREYGSAEYQDCDFVCEFDLLGTLLLLAGERADGVIEALSTGLMADYIQSPTVIDVNALAGGPLEITGAGIKVYRPHVQDQEGKWVADMEDNCYCIAAAESDYKPMPLGAKVAAASRTNSNHFSKAFEDHLALLRQSYEHYKNLLDQEFSKKSARRQAGLTDDMLFRLALLQDGVGK